ncbi:unnamed protein product [Lupinus luteus]|uniref:Protein kinase domain-containing protein n=1 Tax=Lupinus luteus TaxID=3873 RepID=A0AAV1YMK4_LUPLU
MHGDVKAMNLLLGPDYQTYLADFGLVKTARENDHNTNSNLVQRYYLSGSHGYMAPEHASTQPITEKSDVYSYGLVLLEVLIVQHPLDPTLPGGADLVQGVKNHLASKGEPSDILDPKLRGRVDPAMHAMLETLAVSFLCLITSAEDRPMMKGIVAMLKKIRPIESSRVNDDVVEGGLREHSSSPPAKNVVSHEPSNCLYNFSDD